MGHSGDIGSEFFEICIRAIAYEGDFVVTHERATTQVATERTAKVLAERRGIVARSRYGRTEVENR